MKTASFALAALLALPIAASAQGVSDAQIAAIVVTANQVDIDAGKLAKTMATSADVKKFADQMITDHTGVNKSAVDLVTKLKVTPEDNPTSQSLKSGGEKNLAQLKALKGAAFDKAYIDHEVAYHQQVIDALDKTLIPGASNAELKALLVKVRPAFVAHLEHAKHVQAALGKSQASAGDNATVRTVAIEGTAFSPVALRVAVGDTVVWVNNDPFPHTATAVSGGFDSKSIAPDASWRFKAMKKGEFPYVCTLHPTMKGTVTVSAP